MGTAQSKFLSFYSLENENSKEILNLKWKYYKSMRKSTREPFSIFVHVNVDVNETLLLSEGLKVEIEID